MNRRSAKRLHDALNYSRMLVEVARDLSLEDLDDDIRSQLTIHKLMEIIGEALIQARHHEPGIERAITDFRRYANMRNRLVHDYSNVEYDIVLKVAKSNVPLLIEEIESVLAARPPTADVEAEEWFDE